MPQALSQAGNGQDQAENNRSLPDAEGELIIKPLGQVVRRDVIAVMIDSAFLHRYVSCDDKADEVTVKFQHLRVSVKLFSVAVANVPYLVQSVRQVRPVVDLSLDTF